MEEGKVEVVEVRALGGQGDHYDVEAVLGALTLLFYATYTMLTVPLLEFLAPLNLRGWHGSFPRHDWTLLGETSRL